MKNKTILINQDIHRELKLFCDNHGYKIKSYVEKLIQNEINPEVKNEK